MVLQRGRMIMKLNLKNRWSKTIVVCLAVLLAMLLPVNAFALMAPPADVNYIPGAEPTEPQPWYTEAVGELYYRQGIIWDLMDGDYVHPEKPITRGEFVQLLHKLAGEANGGGIISTDPMTWAQDNGILYGYGNGLFPERTLTREEMATILMHFAKYMDRELLWLEEAWDQPAGKFCDAGQISSWAKDGADYCARTGLLKGSMRAGGYYDEKTGVYACGTVPYFDPKASATRAQAIQAVYNYVCEAGIELELMCEMS